MKYYIANPGGQPEGPYEINELKALAISPSVLVYNELLTKWTPAGEVTELREALFNGTPNQPTTPTGFNNQYQQTMEDQSNTFQPVKPKTWLVESILVTLFCCLPFGIVAIIKAASVDSKYNSHDYAGAKLASEEAGKFVKWSFIIGLVVGVIYFGLSILGALS